MKGFNSREPARWQAELALALVALVWGSTFVVVKRALSDISTLYFLALRFTLATVCLLVIFIPAFRSLSRRQLLYGLTGGAVAGLFLWLGYLLQTFGLEFTSAGNSGFLTGLYIVLVPLLSAAVYRRWPRGRELAGVAIASAGMALLTLPADHRSLHMNRGDLLTVGCAVAFAFHLLILGYFSKKEAFQAVALGQIACAALLSGVSLLAEPPRVVWSSGVVFAIVLTAVFATALAFALQTWGQQFTTPTRTALIFALEPVFALAAAVSFGGEPLTAGALAGGALILLAIFTVEWKPGSKALAEPAQTGP